MTCTDSPDCGCAVCAFVHGPAPLLRDESIDAFRDDDGPRERFGAGVCVRGTCIEPCGPNGGCIR